MNHISIDQNPYKNPVRKWLAGRYETEQAEEIWQRTVKNYNAYPELFTRVDSIRNIPLGV